MSLRSFFIGLSLLLATTTPATQAAVRADQIKAAARQFLEDYRSSLQGRYGDEARVEYTISRIDPRLAMTDCPADLTVEQATDRAIGRINLRVRCEAGGVNWSLYVPSEVQLFQPVVVLQRPIARGERISANDLTLRETDVSELSGSYFANPDEVVNMEARRRLKANSVVIASQLQAPLMVRKGDAVIVSASSGGLEVKMPGIALADGARGDQISVRNRQSERVVEARVTAPGQVRVTM